MIFACKYLPKRYLGISIWPFILLQPEFKNNESLLSHEMVHYKEQAWITPIWLACYLFSKKFRMNAEARAFKAQIKYHDLPYCVAANTLLLYDIGINYEEAVKILEQTI